MNGISSPIVMKADDATRYNDVIKAIAAESALSAAFITLVSTRSISKESLVNMRPIGCCSKNDRGAESILSMMLVWILLLAFMLPQTRTRARPAVRSISKQFVKYFENPSYLGLQFESRRCLDILPYKLTFLPGTHF